MKPSDKLIAEELHMHDTLWKWLPSLVADEEAEGVVVHLGDLYGAASKIRDLINELVRADPQDRAKARKNLLAIEVELYDHMRPHMEELRIPLHDLIAGLFKKGLQKTRSRRRR